MHHRSVCLYRTLSSLESSHFSFLKIINLATFGIQSISHQLSQTCSCRLWEFSLCMHEKRPAVGRGRRVSRSRW